MPTLRMLIIALLLAVIKLSCLKECKHGADKRINRKDKIRCRFGRIGKHGYIKDYADNAVDNHQKRVFNKCKHRQKINQNSQQIRHAVKKNILRADKRKHYPHRKKRNDIADNNPYSLLCGQLAQNR